MSRKKTRSVKIKEKRIKLYLFYDNIVPDFVLLNKIKNRNEENRLRIAKLKAEIEKMKDDE